jgi:NAD-dependent deacetylase
MVATRQGHSEVDECLLDRVAQVVRRCKFVVALTGAGISAERGLPPFRDSYGLRQDDAEWQQFASTEAFNANPKKVLDWYAQKRKELRHVEPNPGHLALTGLENRVLEFFLVTQNIDGLHQRAGSTSVVELNGNIWFDRCVGCNYRQRTENIDLVQNHCPMCGNWLRPAVVWLGEALPAKAFSTALEAAGNCELLITIGTSATVQPAASLVFEAKSSGAIIIEINPDQTEASSITDIRLAGRAEEILPELVRRAN